MKVTVIGTGYVGLVSGASLSEMGNDVLCLDVDPRKIELLEQGVIPIHEPGLEDLVRRNVAAGRLRFTLDVARAVSHGTIQFIAVGTPPDEDGSADLQYVLAAARSIGRHMTDYKVVVDKSTVPVGTAIEDFMRPDRIVIGTKDEQALLLMRALYAPFQRNHERVVVMDPRSAELTKYAANAMLATRISFMNELALLAERVGADIEHVRQGIGSDPRIGYHFLYSGAGYGGSCFPKDVKALIRTAADHGHALRVLSAVEQANENQKRVLVEKLQARFPDGLSGLRIALWGLAFKPNTDDLREAPSRTVIELLLDEGATLCAYDPVAMPEAQRVFGPREGLEYAQDPMGALVGADVLVIVTEWKEFRSPDFEAIRAALRHPVVIDGRNMYMPDMVRSSGLEYLAIGRAAVLQREPALVRP